jgi:hypothetical protein
VCARACVPFFPLSHSCHHTKLIGPRGAGCLPQGGNGQGGIFVWLNADGMADAPLGTAKRGAEWSTFCLGAIHNEGVRAAGLPSKYTLHSMAPLSLTLSSQSVTRDSFCYLLEQVLVPECDQS